MGSKLYTRGERIFKWVSLVLLLVIVVVCMPLLQPSAMQGANDAVVAQIASKTAESVDPANVPLVYLRNRCASWGPVPPMCSNVS